MSHTHDTNHDGVFTFNVIEDMIQMFPEVIEDGILLLRTDNCQDQYKCRYVFAKMRNLAKKYDIKMIWFYGEPGHGRGLVDAMSSFGCKQPLKQDIIINDTWYDSAENMVAFLKGHFEGDTSKYYQVIDEESNAKMRSEKQDAHIIKGCRKFCVIAVDQDGNFVKRLYLFKDDENEPTANGGGEDDANDDELYIFGECWALHSDTVFEVVEPTTFVALRSRQNAMEPFYIVEVTSKGEADRNMMDGLGHSVLCGEKYVGVYLQVKSQTIKQVKYEQPRKLEQVYIKLPEIVVTNIDLKDLAMNISEYQAILSAVL